MDSSPSAQNDTLKSPVDDIFKFPYFNFSEFGSNTLPTGIGDFVFGMSELENYLRREGLTASLSAYLYPCRGRSSRSCGWLRSSQSSIGLNAGYRRGCSGICH